LPDARIIGLDVSAPMVSYAEARACSQQRDNVSFQVADARERLPFSQDTFDLVHLQLATSWIKDESWLPLLREVRRVLKPGKYIMITESQLPTSNSPALQRLNQILLTLMRQMQLGMCQDNELGVICALGPLLHQARFFAVTLHEVEIPFSYSMPATDTRWFYDLLALFSQLREQVVSEGLMQDEEYTSLLEQFTEEARREDFLGISKLFTFTARI
jgi:SAM-dependent methyltransferase